MCALVSLVENQKSFSLSMIQGLLDVKENLAECVEELSLLS